MLSAVLLAAIAGCKQQEGKQEEWISGNENGTTRDTTVQDRPYRFYGGMWYPIIGGLISPRMYNGATAADIGRPGFTPSRVRTGGFGSSGRTAVS